MPLSIGLGTYLGMPGSAGVIIPSGPSRLYLTNTAVPFTPAGYFGLWDQTAGSVDKLMTDVIPSAGGTVATPSETSLTNPFKVLAYRGVSKTLQGQTLTADTVTFCLRCVESDLAADAFLRFHVYVMNGSTGAVRGNLITRIVSASELDDVLTTSQSQASSQVVASAGDRVVCELGAQFTNAVATSYSLSFYYDGNGTARATGVTSVGTATVPWVEFTQGIAWGP